MEKNKRAHKTKKALAYIALVLLNILWIFFNRDKRIYFRVKVGILVMLFIFLISQLMNSDYKYVGRVLIVMGAVVGLTFLNMLITRWVENALHRVKIFLLTDRRDG